MFEITRFTVVNNEKVPFIKARFSAKFKALELNDMTIMQNQKGELYVMEPARKYESDGETKYARYYFIDRGLKDQIAEKAITLLHEKDVQTANDAFNAPTLTDDDIPF
jgi:hypothetical protein